MCGADIFFCSSQNTPTSPNHNVAVAASQDTPAQLSVKKKVVFRGFAWPLEGKVVPLQHQ